MSQLESFEQDNEQKRKNISDRMTRALDGLSNQNTYAFVCDGPDDIFKDELSKSNVSSVSTARRGNRLKPQRIQSAKPTIRPHKPASTPRNLQSGDVSYSTLSKPTETGTTIRQFSNNNLSIMAPQRGNREVLRQDTGITNDSSSRALHQILTESSQDP